MAVDSTTTSLTHSTSSGSSCRPDGRAGPPRVRYQRLGKALFSPLAWVCGDRRHCACGRAHGEGPEPASVLPDPFFTPHLAVMTVALAVGHIPCVLLHELHALAGRRLGLPSRLRIGRRYYYVVAETELDALHKASALALPALPRRDRRRRPPHGDHRRRCRLLDHMAPMDRRIRPRHGFLDPHAHPLAGLLLPRDRPLLRHSDGHPLHQPASSDASTALHPLAPRHPQTVGSAA